MRRIWATNGQQKILGPDQIYNNFDLTHATPLVVRQHHPLFSPMYSPNLGFGDLLAKSKFLAVAERELAVWQVGC
jgi:hypothetical protein